MEGQVEWVEVEKMFSKEDLTSGSVWEHDPFEGL